MSENPGSLFLSPPPPPKAVPPAPVKASAVDAKLFGTDLFGEPMAPAAGGPLAKRFLVPPFSVLNAREGDWQERKRAWIALGIQGEVGRGANGVIGGSPLPDFKLGEDGKTKRSGDPKLYGLIGGVSSGNSAEQAADLADRYGLDEDELANGGRGVYANATSVFDPVLCELVFRWFCPPRGKILDPFAGESTKGIVAATLGHDYTGIEVRQAQVDANREQAAKAGVSPNWICGDSMKADEILPEALRVDLVFTSPPYFDLEIYSADEKDGSAFETYTKFMVWYQEIFRQCISRLSNNRFVVVKVGEIRDEEGVYRNFVGDNISCFRSLGLHYYNEIILVTSAGSLPIRAGKQFASGRKIGKTHQNVLCFWKGNPRKIKEVFASADL